MDKMTLDWIVGAGSVLDIFPSSMSTRKVAYYKWGELVDSIKEESAWASVNKHINTQLVRAQANLLHDKDYQTQHEAMKVLKGQIDELVLLMREQSEAGDCDFPINGMEASCDTLPLRRAHN